MDLRADYTGNSEYACCRSPEEGERKEGSGGEGRPQTALGLQATHFPSSKEASKRGGPSRPRTLCTKLEQRIRKLP